MRLSWGQTVAGGLSVAVVAGLLLLPSRLLGPDQPIELAIRAHTVLALAETAERLSLTLLYDEKTRTVKTGDGRVVKPLSYDSVLPES